MDPIGPRITGLEHKAEEIREAVDRIATQRQTVSQGGVQVTFQGGTGLTIAICAAVVSFLSTMVVLAVYLDTRAQVRRIEDYQMTTFMLVPDLKKLVDEERKRREERTP
jgi:hypothetical protein